MVSQLCLMCGSLLNCQTLCLGARPRYNLVVDEDVKKPTNQTKQKQFPTVFFSLNWAAISLHLHFKFREKKRFPVTNNLSLL